MLSLGRNRCGYQRDIGRIRVEGKRDWSHGSKSFQYDWLTFTRIQYLSQELNCAWNGNRNRIERWFRELKNKTKRFYNNVNSKKLKSIEELVTAIAVTHNIIRAEERR